MSETFFTEVGKIAVIEKWGNINSRLLKLIDEDPIYYAHKFSDVSRICDFGDVPVNAKYIVFSKNKKLVLTYSNKPESIEDNEILITNIGSIRINASFIDIGIIDSYLRHNEYSFSIENGNIIVIKCRKLNGIRFINDSKTVHHFINDLSKLIYDLTVNEEKLLNNPVDEVSEDSEDSE